MMSSNGIQCIFDHISSHVEPRLIAGDHHANSGIHPMHSFPTIKANTHPPAPDGSQSSYRGRLAPTPSGSLHMGHAATFRTAFQRAKAMGGTLILRIEDIDRDRCCEASEAGIIHDLQWLGLSWDEGPDLGGPAAPYRQSASTAFYLSLMRTMAEQGVIYPCPLSRSDIQNHPNAIQSTGGDWIILPSMRPLPYRMGPVPTRFSPDAGTNWRFRVPAGQTIHYQDAIAGHQSYTSGIDFGDFIVWRKDGTPSYELAVVADDHRMGITEVVRGADLLVSTCRQIMIYDALSLTPPTFAHCPLILDSKGQRLAKSFKSESIQSYRERGYTPSDYWKAVDAALTQSRTQPMRT